MLHKCTFPHVLLLVTMFNTILTFIGYEELFQLFWMESMHQPKAQKDNVSVFLSHVERSGHMLCFLC